MPSDGLSYWLTAWQADSSVLISLVLLEGAYLLGVGPLRSRFGWADASDPRRVGTFFLGILIIFVATSSPLHDLSERYLFSAHMVQHLLLTLVAPPLLILGTPGWMLRPFLWFPGVFRAGRLLTRPLVAFFLFNGVLTLWHFPGFYNATLLHHNFHIFEHLTFIATAVILWWPVLSSLPELPGIRHPGGQLLYLALQSVPATLLGALLTFTNQPLYPFYAAAPRVWGISAAMDQQIGGLIMKIAWLLVFWLVITIVFFVWAGREEQAEGGSGREVNPRRKFEIEEP